jgi:protein-L-isoaspartate(D-aspartate) O-methyltransferase
VILAMSASNKDTPDESPKPGDETPEEAKELAGRRRAMVEEQIRGRGVGSPRLLEALLTVPRHKFVPEESIGAAYADQPVPIGEGQTISQPYMVAVMTEALELTGTERVLEVGTGSGYQAAVLSLLAREIYSVESHAALAVAARRRLARLGYRNVYVHAGDGTLGLPEFALFDAIVVTAAAPKIPPPLLEQLAEGGRMVIPVGQSENQELLQVRKVGGETTSRVLHYCRFVPLVGRHGWRHQLRG